jgi:hypothetical protein
MVLSCLFVNGLFYEWFHCSFYSVCCSSWNSYQFSCFIDFTSTSLKGNMTQFMRISLV